jgi:hypothetical protein
MKSVAAVFLVCSLLAMVGNAGAQNVEYIGSTFWTCVNEVEIVGDYAYCAFVSGLAIFDVSDSANPVLVSQCRCPGQGEGLDVLTFRAITPTWRIIQPVLKL